ncbi:hypothetical protein AX768_09165 [Burkholderia sp. PAMC 28687]|uniref:hypothetical protein n=1 Tax=Burkholderia sp. PAMC 28687 TaxID=1795874 RepID=UPI0007851C3D|nr:hypothetical protein [Burkholderia sp. PAMC 28687]AMM14238.1 hypothetical protein AX768_09165 [Burkholderia sp. PAMC 28687]
MAETNPNPNAPAVAAPKKASGTVTVYCKLPHGIVYDLRNGKKVKLVGMYGLERSPLQVSGLAGRDSVAGFGVTRGVDAAAWEEIVEDHGLSAAHENGLIFAKSDEKSGAAAAAEREKEKTGFEAYDPDAHPEDKTVDGTRKAV